MLQLYRRKLISFSPATSAEIKQADEQVEDEQYADEPGRPGGPVFDLDIVDEESMKIIVTVGEAPGSEVAERHDESDGDSERNEKPAEAVTDELAAAFPGKGGQNEDAADQEHQGHEKDIVEVFEEVKTIGAGCVDDRVRRGIVDLWVETGEGRVYEGGMVGDDKHRDEPPEVVQPDGAILLFAHE